MVASNNRFHIRPYTFSDRKHIIWMCKDVYQGRDYIPKVLEEYEEKKIPMFVCSEGPGQPARAFIAARVDGKSLMVWGARTDPSYRRRGFMGTLLAHLENYSRRQGVDSIVSTTIEENTTMVRLFNRLEYCKIRRVYGWPCNEPLECAESALEELKTAVGVNTTHHNALDFRPLNSQAELYCAIDDIARHEVHWIPGSFEVLCIDGEDVRGLIGSREIYVGTARAGGSNAVAIIAVSKDQLGRKIASVISNPSFVPSALHFVLKRHRVERLYFDLGDEFLPKDPSKFFDYVIYQKQM